MACPIDADQTTFLPRHSLVSPSRWWEEAAKEILGTSSDVNLIRHTIKFIPLQDPAMAAALLSRRHEHLLVELSDLLSLDEATTQLRSSSLQLTAEAIVATIQWELSSPPTWDGDWLFWLDSSNVFATAQKLDAQIQSEFCKITFREWTAWICGNVSINVSYLFDALLNLRNALAQQAQHKRFSGTLRLLEKELLNETAFHSQHPLSKWIVSTAIKHNLSSKPIDAIWSFLMPIAQQFEEPSNHFDERYCGLPPLGQRLAIISTRFTTKIVCQTDPKWHIPFSSDFSLWERLHKESPQRLAESITRSVECIFCKISYHSLNVGDEFVDDLARIWSDFVNELFACLSADKELLNYILDLAEHFLCLRNILSAGAIGLALERLKYQPQQPSWIWDIINPKEYFSGCRIYAKENRGCLPQLFTDIVEVRRAKTERVDKIVSILTMVAMHFMGEVESKPWHVYLWQILSSNSCIGRM